jgi:hypothetical protein
MQGTPRGYELLKSCPVPQGVWIVVSFRDHAEYGDHIGCDRRVYPPEIREVEAAALLSVPPSKQKVGNLAALSCVAQGNLYEPFKSGFLTGRNRFVCHDPLKPKLTL